MSKSKMNKKDKREVLDKLCWEGGFEYLANGSSFEEYTDPEFRRVVGNLQTVWREVENFFKGMECE